MIYLFFRCNLYFSTRSSRPSPIPSDVSGGSSSTPMGTPQQRGQIRQPPPSATLLSQVPSVEFATKEEAEKAFVKLLRETASSTWMDIGKWIIYIYVCL